nr:MAG TPA: hypothetical protein [Caudoviricetes sp.]
MLILTNFIQNYKLLFSPPGGVFTSIDAKINHKSVFRVGVKGFIC